MPRVDQRLDEKAVDEKTLLHWLNRQLRPVVMRLREVVNGLGAAGYSTTIGDGVTTVFVLAHGLGSQQLVFSFRDVATQTFQTASTIACTAGSEEDSITLTFGVAPAATGLEVNVLRLP